MAAEPQATQAFPNPPAVLYKAFTDEAVASGTAPKPPPPVVGHYNMFGAPFNTNDAMIRSLEEQNIERLYPQQYDKKIELKKLNRSVVICFLELLDILIDNPSSEERNEKVKDLSILFINMHHLINEYRPHQAREALRVVLERQKRQRDDMKHQIKRAIDKAEGLLKTCDSNLQQAVSSLPNIEEPAEPMEVTENNKSTELTENCHSYIDAQDFELINLINGFISQEMIS